MTTVTPASTADTGVVVVVGITVVVDAGEVVVVAPVVLVVGAVEVAAGGPVVVEPGGIVAELQPPTATARQTSQAPVFTGAAYPAVVAISLLPCESWRGSFGYWLRCGF
jgi:hypothetical protein